MALYTDRKQFTYDPELFKRYDSQTAARIYQNYVKVHCARPMPQFFEVDLNQGVDMLWHTPTAPRTQFTQRSPISVPAINQFQKPDWRLTKLGITPQRRDNFYLASLDLEALNYFPSKGDLVFWNGYRYTIINALPPPEAYWQQTGVWLGLLVECAIMAEGDAKPLVNPEVAIAPEIRSVFPLPEP